MAGCSNIQAVKGADMKNLKQRFTIIKGTVYWVNTPSEIQFAKAVLAAEYKNIKINYSSLYETSDPNIILNNPDINLTPIGRFDKDYRYQ